MVTYQHSQRIRTHAHSSPTVVLTPLNHALLALSIPQKASSSAMPIAPSSPKTTVKGTTSTVSIIMIFKTAAGTSILPSLTSNSCRQPGVLSTVLLSRVGDTKNCEHIALEVHVRGLYSSTIFASHLFPFLIWFANFQ